MDNNCKLTPSQAANLLIAAEEVLYDNHGAIYRSTGYSRIYRNRGYFCSGSEEFINKTIRQGLMFRLVGGKDRPLIKSKKDQIYNLVSNAEKKMLNYTKSMKIATEEMKDIKEIFLDLKKIIENMDEKEALEMPDIIEKIKNFKSI